MAILRNDTTVRSADGQTTSAIITAANIGNFGVATTSTYYIGTTQNVFNRASGAQTLTGVSIDGNAATVTNGVYTTGTQTIGGDKTFSSALSLSAGGTAARMFTFYTNLTNTDDWTNSAVSIRERDLVAATQNSNIYSPNINFHWASRISNSLWMDANGNLAWGSYDGSGVPSSDGAFYANNLYASIYFDKNDTTYYLDAANTGTSLALAGNAGVGTASPTLSSGKGIHINSSSGHANLKLQSSGRTWELLSTTGAYFSVYDTTGGADRLTVTSGGNVGVATTSADTNLQVVGHVHVGNQTTFENTGGWNKTIYLDGAVHARMRILGSAFASGKNSATETSIWVDNSVSPYSGLDTNAGSFRISAGFTTLTNSARSPIFYDSDDTNYYVDPASTTNLLTLSVNRINNLRPYVDTWHTSTDGTRRFFFANGGTTYYSTANNYVFRNASDVGVVTIDGSGNLRTSTSGDNYASYSLHVGGTGFATADFRSPIFYDSNDTNYYADPASTSVFNRLKIDGGNFAFDYFQSLSDFTSGTLVTTDIPATAAEGESFVMNVVGKSYSASASPFNFTVQGYLYSSTIINFSGIKLDSTGLTSVKIFENGGVLCFWWPTVSYWNAFEVSVRAYNSAKNNYNRVTNITNSTEPTGTKKVTVTLQSFLRADVSATNSVDLRAPIFYDSNNTAYYCDPASTSVFNALTVGGNNVLTTASTLTAGNLSGTIPSGVLGNSTLYVGTTAIALNRGSASQTLTGISIDGNAATATTATNATQLGGVAAANYVRNDVDGSNSTALFRLTTITKSLTINTTWQDTGIIGSDLSTGCYMISVYVDNYAVSGGHYQETYTGMMSWFSTGTNSTDYDEIVLHKSGHASNGAYINLRTIRQLSGSTNLKLQIISSVSTSGASNYVFKFRRLI